MAVPVVDPPATGAALTACQALLAALPRSLSGQESRGTEPRNSTTAAWGNPPIVLRCGVVAPTGLTPITTLVEVDGVKWFPVQLSEGYRFTSTSLVPYVEVTVPSAYSPEVNTLVGLAAPMKATLSAAPAPQPS